MTQRYWNGSAWEDQIAPLPGDWIEGGSNRARLGPGAVFGYALALAAPPLGLFYGLFAARRYRGLDPNHGQWIFGLSAGFLLVWFLVSKTGL